MTDVSDDYDKPTREEHLAWCKQRALEFVDKGDLAEACTSMTSDMLKHPETQRVAFLLSSYAVFCIVSGDAEGIRRWINGFR